MRYFVWKLDLVSDILWMIAVLAKSLYGRRTGHYFIILRSFEIFLTFPNFLRSITNNHSSFQLWLKGNLINHQKVSKYYENYCSFEYNSRIKDDNAVGLTIYCGVINVKYRLY